MRQRSIRMVVTFATSVTIACGDAAVDSVTAPKLAAKPASPVAGQFPFWWEIGPEASIGIEVDATSRFEDNYHTFVASADITFQWANQVSAMLDASLLNKNGQTVNSGKKGLTYMRVGLPVAQGDTTLTVRVSTNNITCGLVGKGGFVGSAELIVLDISAVQIKLFGKSITTATPDVEQPACPPPPGCESEPATRVIGGTTAPLASTSSDCLPEWFPPMGGNEEFEVCYTVWRELWLFDYLNNTYSLITSWIVGVICYTIVMS